MHINPERGVQPTVLDFLRQRYKETRWPFTRMKDIIDAFGTDRARSELNQLFREKKVYKREGNHGIIVELNTKAKK